MHTFSLFSPPSLYLSLSLSLSPSPRTWCGWSRQRLVPWSLVSIHGFLSVTLYRSNVNSLSRYQSRVGVIIGIVRLQTYHKEKIMPELQPLIFIFNSERGGEREGKREREIREGGPGRGWRNTFEVGIKAQF